MFYIEQRRAIERLKAILTTVLLLRPLDYSEKVGEIVVIVNTSNTEFSFVLY